VSALLIVLVILAAVPAAAAERVVVSLSTDRIAIASNFAGDSLALFGVIERRGAVSRTGPYQVLVEVRGPPEDVLVQRKERRFGIWVNSAGERFESIPSYYGLFTTENAGDVAATLSHPGQDPSLRWMRGSAHRGELRAALAERRRGKGLYVERYGAVTMLTDTFFRTAVPLPSVVDDGVYRVNVFLYADGVPLDIASTHFVIAKVGLEQRVFDLSRRSPLLYGLAAVALALVTGYVGGVVFRRT